MTHPDILQAERIGYIYPQNDEPKLEGHCCECGEELYDDDGYLIDDDGQKYCDTDCVMRYFGIREVD